jgi:flagellar hook-associated protein 2
MTITFSGLSSGLDTQAIVSAMVKVEQVPLTRIQARQSDATSAKSGLSSFMSTISSLRTASAALSDPTGFSSLSATSGVAGVSASILGASSPGSFSVQVTQLATEQRTQSDGQTSSTDALGQNGTLDLTDGTGAAVSVNVTADDSLTSIAAKIATSGARATASVTYDGAQYHLLLRGLDTGAANALTIGESGTSLGLSTPANTYQAAGDAKLTLDGFQVTRPTNVVTGAIPGVTLNLSSTSSTPGTVTVASDSSALKSKISGFVSAYNTVLSSAHFTAGYGTITAQATLLQGDSAVRETMSRLTSVLTETVPGTTGKYTNLGSVGVALAKDGSLTFDATKLDAALLANPDAVAKIFTTNTATGATGVMGTLDTTVDSLTVGSSAVLQSRVDALGKQATQLGDDATRMQTRIDTFTTAMQAQFTALEVTMSNIKIQSSAYQSLFNAGSSSSSSGSSSSGTTFNVNTNG